MDRRAPGPATPMRTFAALAALLAAGLTLPAGQPRPAAAQPVPAWSRSVPRPGPAALRPVRRRAPGMVLRMAGPAGRAPARPGFRMHTLTIKGFGLAGTPDTGDLVQLFDVDDTALIDPQAGSGVFDNGTISPGMRSAGCSAAAE
jgi:hypothetical protein